MGLAGSVDLTTWGLLRLPVVNQRRTIFVFGLFFFFFSLKVSGQDFVLVNIDL